MSITTFTRLQDYLANNQYKRGQYKGEAPAEHNNRSKNHFRVRKDWDTYAIRFHATDILTAYPNGAWHPVWWLAAKPHHTGCHAPRLA